MTFISIDYGLFLLGFLGIYWFLGRTSADEHKSIATASSSRTASLMRSQTLSHQLWALVIASLIFYASLQIQYIPLLLIVTLINFLLGKALGTNTTPGAHATNQRLSNEAWQRAQMVWNRRRLRLLWLALNIFRFC
jgi:alginate O-acetyltransferase complex protein AlgI